MHVHEEVLAAAVSVVARNGGAGVFTLPQILPLLKHLNESTVRTHVVSRCCVNAPKNHPHKWGYFRRVGYGKYEIMPQYRRRAAGVNGEGRPTSSRSKPNPASAQGGKPPGHGQRDTIHVIVSQSDGVFTAECVEVSVVTEGRNFDDLLTNLHDALALHLGGEDLAAFGLTRNPRLQVLYEAPLTV